MGLCWNNINILKSLTISFLCKNEAFVSFQSLKGLFRIYSASAVSCRSSCLQAFYRIVPLKNFFNVHMKIFGIYYYFKYTCWLPVESMCACMCFFYIRSHSLLEGVERRLETLIVKLITLILETNAFVIAWLSIKKADKKQNMFAIN